MKNILKMVGLCAISLLLGSQNICAKGSDKEAYNVQRGFEALKDGNYQLATEYLQKELDANPKNGFAHLWMGCIVADQGNLSMGMSHAEDALRYIPKNENDSRAAAFNLKSTCYAYLGDTARAIAELDNALKGAPKNTAILKSRGNLYLGSRQYAKAEADFNKIKDLEPGNVNAAYQLARVSLKQKKYDEAITRFNYAEKLCNRSYGVVPAYRAEAYLAKGELAEATDDLINAFLIDENDVAIKKMTELEGDAERILDTKLKIQMRIKPNDTRWPNLIAVVAQEKRDFAVAAEYYKKSIEIEPNANISMELARSLSELGNYAEAMNQWKMAHDLDSTIKGLQYLKCDILMESGDYDAAKVEIDKYVADNPNNPTAYHTRAWLRREVGDYQGALEDCNTVLTLNPKYSHAYLMRGFVYQKLNQPELAKADYEKLVKIDSAYSPSSSAQYGYYYLGQKEKAIAFSDSCIARAEKKSYVEEYNAACLYSIMNEKEKAIEHMRKALERGCRGFAHISRDEDLDNIRNTKEFNDLIAEYKKKLANETSATVVESVDGESTEVPFIRESGVCKVKCSINGLQLHFIFDTGASSVSISNVEATFMMKNGYLTENDVVGSQHFMDANGNVSVGTVINLKKVNFGGLELNNIRASVVQNQKAPLLLGQTVLTRLGKIEIDNQKRVLRITKTEKKAKK